MSNQEIQLTETRKLDKNTPEIVVETNPQEVRPASISTLFLRYSTKKERAILFFGFAFAIISGILGPFSYTYYGDLLNALIQTPLNASTVAFVLSMFTLFMGLSAIFAFCERFCLSFFAGGFRSCQ
ncbi:hypothetical protein JH06_5813 [Blastocystis sp. subtype 4]|uniref:hypothetical protein n=1 Tax=Blastocystis sp. subtype 4 TaxID=944170 RepID=UPI0007117614|nr:hypothetical protein JH06_5813 [Blastocystis sp. subtype 4]KNB41677.1 hypothetical protein JH06_5813 [Blastocystis sp. subtype 4]|eukprot:XP_014525120.1 hypothetical protein JH06_5813 [Blastocystis sp. subtype 4]